jgi:hypothetical protein
MEPGKNDEIEQSAFGNVRSSSLDPSHSARFSWLDRETGERITVEIQGSEAFLAELEALGFEPAPEGSGASQGGRTGERARVDSSVERSGDRDRAGSTHPLAFATRTRGAHLRVVPPADQSCA